jgi:hypothetical protein
MDCLDIGILHSYYVLEFPKKSIVPRGSFSMTNVVESGVTVSVPPQVVAKKAVTESKKAKVKDDRIHSITFYIPKKKVPFYSESLKTLAKLDHGSETSTGKVSKYLRSLIDRDFKARGLLNDSGEPRPEALENLKTKLGA